MEPFSITCHSCAARLKVTRPELIEQTLACPQCGSMIHVQHPTGWKPPIPESKGSLSALSNVVSSNDFEQIEDLLPKPGEQAWTDQSVDPTAATKTASPNPEKARFQKAVPAAKPTANSNQSRTTADQPILPGQQWASPSAQQRKKLTLMIGSAIGTVLLVAIAIATIVRMSGDSPQPNGGKIANADPAASPIEDAPKPPEGSNDDSTEKPPKDSATSADNENSNQFLDNGPTINQLPIAQNPNPVLNDTPEPTFGGFSAPKPNNDAAPIIPGVNPPVAENNPINDAKPAPKKSKSLQDLLVEYGISAGELEDVAILLRSYEDSSSPKYSMTPPKTKNSNFQRLLQLPIRKLDAPNGISLARAARTISQLSGVPIAVDTRQLSLMGLPANPTLKLALKDETTISAAKKIAELAGAQATVVGDGIFITLPADPKNTDFKIAFPKVGDLTDEEKQGFLAAIQALIAPEVWSRANAPATIRFEGDTILINAGKGIHRHVQILIERMNAAVEIAADSNNDNASAILASRWSASEPLRKQPTGWLIGPNLPLASFLDRIERIHGLTVMVDWPPVLAAGWTPLTEVPGELVELEVGEAIRHLSKAMNLRVIGVDEKTLQLTTEATANGIQDIEVYPLLADWAGQTESTEIEQLIFTALGQQVRDSFVRVVYEPKCRCLIVVAPQPIQHQVEKLVERLNRTVKAKGDDR